MKFKLIAFLFLFFSNWVIFSFTSRREYFYIHNNSSETIITTAEINLDPAPRSNGEWYIGNVYGIPVSLMYSGPLYFSATQTNCLADYRPLAPWEEIVDKQYYEKLEAIPMLEKLKVIFKTFTITDTNGNVLLTLDDIKAENIIRTSPPYNTNIYTLEFYPSGQE
jgi:hypothetical protein